MNGTTRAKWDRIVAAVDVLLNQEAALAIAASGQTIVALRQRISPLLAFLAETASQDRDEAMQADLDRLVAKRRGNITLMQHALGRIRCALAERAGALQILSRTRQAYRRRRGRQALLNGAA